MMPSQWPDAGRIIDPSALDAWGGPFARPGAKAAASPAAPPDGLSRPWWTAGNGATGGGFGGFGGFGAGDGSGGSLFALIGNIVSQLQRLVGGYLNDGLGDGGPQQRFTNLDVSSTGDPHLAAVGTRSGNCEPAVNDHFDSMTAHDDLVHSSDVESGYRVSTTVTQPDANGITWNRSATVHAGGDWDRVTMNRDGSSAITSGGDPVQLDAGHSLQLSGGETVTRNKDGSLTVDATGVDGGTIATTLRASGNGVDVTTHAQNIAVGGDVLNHDAQPVRAHGHGHHHHRYPTGGGGAPRAEVPAATVPPEF